jgi:hypothetical protein
VLRKGMRSRPKIGAAFKIAKGKPEFQTLITICNHRLIIMSRFRVTGRAAFGVFFVVKIVQAKSLPIEDGSLFTGEESR